MRRRAAQGALFGRAVASVAGIASSDLDCLDILNLEQRVTAGRLAEVSGLTTGAITGVIDRLEKAGLVRRERDKDDRRKIFIVSVRENVSHIAHLYLPMQEEMQRLWDTYSDADLQLLLRFTKDSYKAALEATRMISNSSKARADKCAGSKTSESS